MKNMLSRKGPDPRMFILLSIFLLLNVKTYAQDASFAHRVDSLTSALKHSEGATRQKILHDLAYEYLQVDDAKALPYSTESFKMAWQSGDSIMIVKSGRVRTQIF